MSQMVVIFIKLYQSAVSPVFRAAFPQTQCRFNPTCSQYTINSIQKYGLFIGIKKGLQQLSHCHPYA